MKHKELFIPIEKETDPFENCKLERKPYAEILTSIVVSYQDGFVMALDGAWGTGKTTFVKMWNQHLKNQGFKTIYFNAWENDSSGNPLVSIMAEFKTLEDESSDDIRKVQFKNVLQKGGSIAKAAAPAILKAVLKRYIDTDEIADALSDAATESINVLEEEITEHNKKKEGLEAFQKELKKYVDELTGDKPLVFIIDELDRCRPNYAVEVLEQIKHIFSLDGIVFVLSIDKTQLGHAVRGVYGSEKIDADEYLRRFIDLEYSLPEPDSKKLTAYIVDYFDFDEFFEYDGRHRNKAFNEEKNDFVLFANILFDRFNMAIRQRIKFLSLARILLKGIKPNHYLFPTPFLFLLFLHQYKQETYSKLKKRSLSFDEILDAIHELILKKNYNLFINKKHKYVYLEAIVISLYNNKENEYNNKTNILTTDKKTNSPTSLFKTRFKNHDNPDELARMFEYIRNNRFDDISLEYITDKIELLDDLSIKY